MIIRRPYWWIETGLTNVDESDQPSGDGGNVNDGNIGESESVVLNEIPRKAIF